MARILMIDDDEDFTSAASLALRKNGYEVEVIHDPRGAETRLAQDPPDLLVLDVMFPVDCSAGFDLARQIRTQDSLSDLPILMLTAVNTRFPLGFGPDDIDDEWLPVQDFLEKPVDFNVMLQRVEKLVSKKAAVASGE